MSEPRSLGPAGRFARAWISSKLTPAASSPGALLIGAFAVWKLPREEEPQIIVPMIDVFVQMPGASAHEVEERVTKPMEKLLWEIPGVEYIYSTSSPGMSLAIVRFYVGQDEEKSIVRLNQKLYANFDLIPPGASPPLVKPRSIDDVPILALTLSSKRYGDYELRRIAAQLHDAIKQVPDVSAVTLIGGQRREIRIVLDAGKLAGYNLSPLQVAGALGLSNRRLPSGQFDTGQPRIPARNRRVPAHRRGRAQRGGRACYRRSAGLRPQRGGSDRRRRGAVAVRAHGARRPAIPARGHHRGGQAQRHQRHHRRRQRAEAPRAPEGQRHPLRRPDGHHPPLRRNRGREIQRTAVPHADRGGLGEHPDRDHARASANP